MTKIIISTYLLFCLFISNSFAQLAVIDAAASSQTSILIGQQGTNFANMIAEAAQTTAAVTETVKNTIELKEYTLQQLESITGNLGLSSPLLDDINNILTQYSDLTVALPTKLVNGRSVNNRETEDIKILLKEIYSDHSDPRKEIYEPIRLKYYADALHAALTLSESVINNADERIKAIEDPIQKADSNQTLKEAMDVNNRILAQMLVNQEQQIQLLAHLVHSTTSRDFEGTYPNVKKKEMTRGEEMKATRENPMFKPRNFTPQRISIFDEFIRGRQ